MISLAALALVLLVTPAGAVERPNIGDRLTCNVGDQWMVVKRLEPGDRIYPTEGMGLYLTEQLTVPPYPKPDQGGKGSLPAATIYYAPIKVMD